VDVKNNGGVGRNLQKSIDSKVLADNGSSLNGDLLDVVRPIDLSEENDRFLVNAYILALKAREALKELNEDKYYSYDSSVFTLLGYAGFSSSDSNDIIDNYYGNSFFGKSVMH
jgi:hypothetical protein